MTATTAAPIREDARNLQLRLYREIGISAVAAALRITPEPAAERPRAGEPTAVRTEAERARAA